MGNGLISKIMSWFTHPFNDQSTPQEWLAGIVLILILAFLWSTVVKMVAE